MAHTRLRRLSLLLLVLVICLFVVWPTVSAMLIRREVVSALRRARTVLLEEYVGNRVLTTVELPRGKWHEVVQALPVVPDMGIPLLVKLCFDPHHRIVLADEHGRYFTFSVCFECDQVATDSSSIIGTPYLWRSSVRRLFSEHQIPIRNSREYGRILIQDLPARTEELPSASAATNRPPLRP
jgi:hypothetical protein